MMSVLVQELEVLIKNQISDYIRKTESGDPEQKGIELKYVFSD